MLLSTSGRLGMSESSPARCMVPTLDHNSVMNNDKTFCSSVLKDAIYVILSAVTVVRMFSDVFSFSDEIIK